MNQLATVTVPTSAYLHAFVNSPVVIGAFEEAEISALVADVSRQAPHTPGKAKESHKQTSQPENNYYRDVGGSIELQMVLKLAESVQQRTIRAAATQQRQLIAKGRGGRRTVTRGPAAPKENDPRDMAAAVELF